MATENQPPADRTIRYQGAVIRDHHLLLIKHNNYAENRAYWLLPGGGRVAGETEEACVRRELAEETHLEVTVERLLLDEPGYQDGGYQRYKTYLCSADSGEPHPGSEPEFDEGEGFGIIDVGWIDLRSEDAWGEEITADLITYPLLQRIRVVLHY